MDEQKNKVTNNSFVKRVWQNNKLAVIILTAAIVLIAACAIFIIIITRVKNSYAGEQWYNSEVEKTELPEITSFEGMPNSESSISDKWEYGNTVSRYAFKASLAEDDKNIYMSNPLDEGKLYRISKEDYEMSKLLEMRVDNVSVINGKIYFINDDTSEGKACGIYSVNTDGTDLQLLMEGIFDCLTLVNDWAYYRRTTDYVICKFQINERREIEIFTDRAWEFTIFENELYTWKTIEDEDTKTTQIIRMDVDGNNSEVLIDYSEPIEFGDGMKSNYIYNFYIYDGKFYYYIPGAGYGSIPLNKDIPWGAEDYDDSFVKIENLGYMERLQFYGEEMWFIDSAASNKIAIKKPDEESLQYIDIEGVWTFYIVDDHVIIKWLTEDSKQMIGAYSIETGEPVNIF